MQNRFKVKQRWVRLSESKFEDKLDTFLWLIFSLTEEKPYARMTESTAINPASGTVTQTTFI